MEPRRSWREIWQVNLLAKMRAMLDLGLPVCTGRRPLVSIDDGASNAGWEGKRTSP